MELDSDVTATLEETGIQVSFSPPGPGGLLSLTGKMETSDQAERVGHALTQLIMTYPEICKQAAMVPDLLQRLQTLEQRIAQLLGSGDPVKDGYVPAGVVRSDAAS